MIGKYIPSRVLEDAASVKSWVFEVAAACATWQEKDLRELQARVEWELQSRTGPALPAGEPFVRADDVLPARRARSRRRVPR